MVVTALDGGGHGGCRCPERVPMVAIYYRTNLADPRQLSPTIQDPRQSQVRNAGSPVGAG
jgi:hypothetical protein